MDIMKFFLSDPNSNDPTSQDVDFFQRLNQFDENALGEFNEPNYSLETDPSFENCTKEKFDYALEPFDCTLNQNNFTNINLVQANGLGEFGQGSNGIKPIQTLSVKRISDSIGKFSLRLSLKQSCSKESFGTILNLLADASVKIEIGGSPHFQIPKLLLVYLICSELGINIEYLDAQVFNSTYSKDEIKSMIRTKREESWVYTNKYYFETSNSRYIDIPLLDQFLSYDMPIPIIALSYHDTRFTVSIPSSTELNKYIESIHIISENIIYLDKEKKEKMRRKAHELVKMNFSMYYTHGFTSQTFKEYGQHFSKFMFVFIRPSSSNQDIGKTDLPTIQSVEIEIDNSTYDNLTVPGSQPLRPRNTYTIEQTNMYLAEYDNIYVYGIALDAQSNMKNWVKIVNECNDLYKTLANAEYTNPGIPITNLNTWASTQTFKCVNVDRFRIHLSNYSIPVNIEVFIGTQNIQRVMSGMSGEVFGY